MGDIREGTFAALFDELTDGICISNGYGEVIYINPAAEQMLGLDGGIEQGANFCDLLCGRLATEDFAECKTHCPLLDKHSSQSAVTYEGTYDKKPMFRWVGEHIHRLDNAKRLRVRCMQMPTPWADPKNPEKHLTIIEDVSAQKELEERKKAWRDMVSHDLRAPLASILGALSGVEDTPAGRALKQSEKELLLMGLKAAQRMMELLNDHLDVASLDAGKMPIHLEVLFVNELTAQCVEEQRPLAMAKSIELETDIPPSLSLKADRHLLQRVIQNLLNNALKFTPEDGKIFITAKKEGDQVLLSVRDTGIGISREDLPLIFDRYHHALARFSGEAQGSGLGLAFCLEAVKAMGGTIKAQSEPGRGSEFSIRLPRE